MQSVHLTTSCQLSAQAAALLTTRTEVFSNMESGSSESDALFAGVIGMAGVTYLIIIMTAIGGGTDRER